MKRLLAVIVPVILLGGCSRAPEVQEPPVAQPELSIEEKQAAQDEAQWLALYDRVMKNATTKYFAVKSQPDALDAISAVAEKDFTAILYSPIPRNYALVRRKLKDAFPALHDGYLYIKMGLQTNDKGRRSMGQQKMDEAARLFAETRKLAAEAEARKQKAKKAAAKALE